MIPFSRSPAWLQLLAHRDALGGKTARELWRADPARGAKLTVGCAELALDFSKQPVSEETLASLCALARERGLPEAIAALFSGAPVNTTERRAALHMALRGDEHTTVGGVDVLPEIQRGRERMRMFSQAVREGHWKGATGAPVRHVVGLGIGGSSLGPKLAAKALHAIADGPQAHFIENLDPAEFDDTVGRLDPAATLFVIASKTFTTEETMANAASARAWIERSLGPGAVDRHFVAATASPERATAWGLAACNVFPFPEWVGGRFSLWSEVGLPVAIAVGMTAFDRLLAGAHAVDLEFRSKPLERNAPVLLALLSVWNRNALGCASHVVLPYAARLTGLTPYVQALEMESNGKRVDRDGTLLDFATAPAVFGGEGTPGQHAFHQWLHQGTDAVSSDFIVVARPMGSDADRHARLVAHAAAQSEALMNGVETPEPWRSCPGGRASTTIVMPALDPFHLGSLLALYEHKVFAEGALWGINSFDQWGVELGKKIAGSILPAARGEGTAPDAATAHLLSVIHKLAQSG
ncbi:Glucose-6-phosphate isomerase [Usitatibacter rugosus]|uniref:Glucose-6-phosphate isomerase n=1 Tax=Usitatibacter rugosus TaxID=2732067 RepID=A0A6M4GYE3_9PROT|nr:glucose-6-phosphate isomerase [Usitatibacter rugosus]QJR12300.1 Glucose-6-phosphate isomerase [Usitatibacter rugosus]